MEENQVNIRYMVESVDDSIEFYSKQLGFTLGRNASPGNIEHRPRNTEQGITKWAHSQEHLITKLYRPVMVDLALPLLTING
ncbi:MAG TPA: hypothetical protein VD884_23080 [Ohtaekwangia sp.]|nr:hypothetical protein [Ohtaekwangia sp.]